MRAILKRIAVLCLPVACVSLGVAQAENWPGWRGADRNGVSTESNIVTHWSADKHVAWRVPLAGAGISSPIVWQDRVYLTASTGHNLSDLHVICLSLRDGQLQWHQRFWGTAPTRYHGSKSSMATPVPVTDGQHVFAFFGTGDLFCLQADGALVWQRSLAGEYGVFENRFAASSSPVLFGKSVIIQCDHYGDSYVLAIDKQSGANLWKTPRPECWLSWASPQLIPVGNSHAYELLLSGSHKLDAYDPATGQHLWTVGDMQRECIPTPVFGNGVIYAVSGPSGFTQAIRPGGRGDVSQSHVIWKTTRGAPFVPSAILVGDHYYLVNDSGIATCLDVKTGRPRWQKRLGGAYTASPLAADGKIYLCNEAGETVVLRAETDAYQELARNPLGEPVYATPAVSQGRLLIRTTKHLYCLTKPR